MIQNSSTLQCAGLNIAVQGRPRLQRLHQAMTEAGISHLDLNDFIGRVSCRHLFEMLEHVLHDDQDPIPGLLARLGQRGVPRLRSGGFSSASAATNAELTAALVFPDLKNQGRGRKLTETAPLQTFVENETIAALCEGTSCSNAWSVVRSRSVSDSPSSACSHQWM